MYGGNWAVLVLPRLNDRDHSSLLPHFRKVNGAESYIKFTGQEGKRSLGKIPQSPIRDTVWTWSLADI